MKFLQDPNVMAALLPFVQAVIVPMLLAGLKSLAPRVPRPWIPVLAPLLGALLDIGTYFATGISNPAIAALAGSAGVGIRELVDQLRKHSVSGAAPADGPIQPPS